MPSTIQIHKKVKEQLASLKTSGQSYEGVIKNLLEREKKEKMKREKELAEGYEEMAKDSLAIDKEWGATDKWDVK